MSDVIPHWLNKQADLSPEGTAIETQNNKKLTFVQLKNRSRTYAKKLASYGVGKGDHIAILSANSIEMVVALHAVSYIGAVAVLLNIRLSALEIAYQLKDAQVTLLLTHQNTRMLAVNSAGEVPKVAVKTFEEVDKQEEAMIDLQEELDLEALFTIIYTSGTTGFPKGVKHTYGNHWWSAVSSVLNLGLSERDKWLAALPLFHVGGLSILLKSVIYGMPVYLLDKFDADYVHEAVMKKGITIVSVVAVMLQRLMERLGRGTYPEQFRCMLLGGGPASASLLEKAKAHRVPVFQTYGMTETTSQIATLSPKYALIKLGSAGKPLFPAQLKIMNANRLAEPLEAGEIFVKGPMVTKGYYRQQEANQKVFQKGWLATGDLGYLDESGFLYILDRRKDLIISGGENIYPAEVESVLAGMKGIKEAGVIGKDDKQWGQVPVAFLVKESTLTEEAVIEYCSKQLAGYKVPKHVFFIDELPRNASNKLMRHKLAELL